MERRAAWGRHTAPHQALRLDQLLGHILRRRPLRAALRARAAAAVQLRVLLKLVFVAVPRGGPVLLRAAARAKRRDAAAARRGLREGAPGREVLVAVLADVGGVVQQPALSLRDATCPISTG